MEETQSQSATLPEDLMAPFVEPPKTEQPATRDEQGRFVKPEAETKPVAAEQPATEEAKPEGEAEAPADEYKWDELKDIRLKIPMKKDGKEWEEELSLHDLREGRMMREEFLNKTRELAEKERAVKAEAEKAVQNQRQQYINTLGVLHQSILQAAAPELQNVNWNQLAASNPAEYVRLANRAREVSEALARVQGEQQRVKEQMDNETTAKKQAAIQESRQKVLEAIPEWNEDRYQGLLRRAVDTYGFKPDEIGEIYDHRIVRMLDDANQFRAMKENAQTTQKKVANIAPLLKPGAQKQSVAPQLQKLKSAKDALQKAPDDRDAAANLLGTLIGAA